MAKDLGGFNELDFRSGVQDRTGRRAVRYHLEGPPPGAGPRTQPFYAKPEGVTGSEVEDPVDSGLPAVASHSAVENRRSSRLAANRRNGDSNPTAGAGVSGLHGEGVGDAVGWGARVARGNSIGSGARKRSRTACLTDIVKHLFNSRAAGWLSQLKTRVPCLLIPSF
ncbi:hypothetical protein GGS21DRAFT_489061 [Xylaria nigripes]|nr:hypothetical protein GGS21DRAFT_489061 [Xylaria nigripes]